MPELKQDFIEFRGQDGAAGDAETWTQLIVSHRPSHAMYCICIPPSASFFPAPLYYYCDTHPCSPSPTYDTYLLQQRLTAKMQANGVSKTAIIDEFAHIPMFKQVKDIIAKLLANPKFDVRIVSDANDVFIDSCLKGKEIDIDSKHIVTNAGWWNEKDQLQIRMFHEHRYGSTHECDRCPPQMCKSFILRELLQASTYARRIYFGDGGGDACPVINVLREGDVVFARRDFAMHRRSAGKTKAKVLAWSDGVEMLKHFSEHIDC
jgi:pyridoxal phosphate phosphatase PHOSPHO2